MATYRQRGKKKTWDYRIFNEKSELVASGSGFRTKREAMLEAQEIEKKKTLGGAISANNTLYELWLEWFNLTILPSNLAETTKNKYFARGSAIKRYFLNKKVSKIKHSEYQRVLNDYGKKFTKNHVRRFNSDIRKSIQLALRDGLLINDFTVGVSISGKKCVKDVDDKYLHSISEYRKVTNYLTDHLDYSEGIIYYLLLVLFKTGLRVGEALALTWSDIDFKKKELKTYRRFSGDRGEFASAKTKTSIRKIPISEELCQILLGLKNEQSTFSVLSETLNFEQQVFFDLRYGVPSNSAINKSLRNLLKKLAIDSKMSATGARHTYGSYLLANGVDIWVVSKLMGHKDISQLVETYGHVLTEVVNKEYDEVRKFISQR